MPKEKTIEQIIHSSFDQLADALDSIQDHVTSISDSEVLPLTLRLLAEEAITNIMRHGYTGEHGPIEIRSTSSEEDFTIELRDQGAPFDPTAKPETTGLQLLHAIADTMEYERKKDMNVLILKKMLS